MTDLASLLAGLDAGERVRGRGFERLCRWVLENAPEYAAKVDKVWLWGTPARPAQVRASFSVTPSA